MITDIENYDLEEAATDYLDDIKMTLAGEAVKQAIQEVNQTAFDGNMPPVEDLEASMQNMAAKIDATSVHERVVEIEDSVETKLHEVEDHLTELKANVTQ